MAKITLPSILTNYSSGVRLDSNFEALEAAIENTLSRDGTSPNAMEASLDMNSNHIVNLPAPTLGGHAATKTYVDGLAIDSASADLERLKLVDGAGSGFDADLLDGQHGTHYLDYNNFTNTPTIPTAAATVVDTYAEMDALTGLSDDDLVITRGRAAVDDGGYGVWKYDAGSSATANIGTVRTPSTLPGRFLRVVTSPFIHSKWFAVGNGVATDTTALQAWLDSGTMLWLDDGTYLSEDLDINDNTVITANRGLATLKQITSTGNFLNIEGDYVTLDGLIIDGNYTTDTYAGGYTASHYLIECSGTSMAYTNGLTVKNCELKNAGDQAIFGRYVDSAKILNNTVHRCGYAGIGFLSPIRCEYVGNNVYDIYPGDGSDNAYGMYLSNSGGQPQSLYCIMRNNVVDGVVSWEGIDIHNGKYCSILGNIVLNCSQGIAYEDHITNEQGDSIIISDNIVIGWSGTSTTRDSQTYYKAAGIVAVGANTDQYGKSLTITNNNVTGMGDTRPGGSAAIYARNWDGYNISGNNVRDAYARGIALGEAGTASMINGIMSNNTIAGVTTDNSVTRGFEIVEACRGIGVGNRVYGLQTGTEKFWVETNGHFKFINPKEVLYANRNYYVRTDGSDTNDGSGNTSSNAWLTIQHAIDTVCEEVDTNGYDVYIEIQDATWTEAIVLKEITGGGRIILNGNTTTPASCVFSTTSANCVTGTHVSGHWYLAGIKFQTTTSGNAVYATGNGLTVDIDRCDFGGVGANRHMVADLGANIFCVGNYNITGAAYEHLYAIRGGRIQINNGLTVTLTGTPAFSGYFASALRMGFIQAISTTFSGSATGARYSAVDLSLIVTGGGGATYFPGNSAGSTSTGSQYT